MKLHHYILIGLACWIADEVTPKAEIAKLQNVATGVLICAAVLGLVWLIRNRSSVR